MWIVSFSASQYWNLCLRVMIDAKGAAGELCGEVANCDWTQLFYCFSFARVSTIAS